MGTPQSHETIATATAAATATLGLAHRLEGICQGNLAVQITTTTTA
jgi:hypothetical protein